METIIRRIGYPSKEDLSYLTQDQDSDYLAHEYSFLLSKKNSLSKLFPNVDKDLVHLVKRMLEFNPYFRITTAEALKNKAFDDIREPHYEQPCPKQLVIKGYQEDEFDYETEISESFKSTQDLLKAISHE